MSVKLPLPKNRLVTFTRMLTQGVNSSPTVVFEANSYQSGTDEALMFPCRVSSILLTNTSEKILNCSIFIVDGDTTGGDELSRTYILKNTTIDVGKNLECLKNDINMNKSDKILAVSSDVYSSFDVVVSFNELLG